MDADAEEVGWRVLVPRSIELDIPMSGFPQSPATNPRPRASPSRPTSAGASMTPVRARHDLAPGYLRSTTAAATTAVVRARPGTAGASTTPVAAVHRSPAVPGAAHGEHRHLGGAGAFDSAFGGGSTVKKSKKTTKKPAAKRKSDNDDYAAGVYRDTGKNQLMDHSHDQHYQDGSSTGLSDGDDGDQGTGWDWVDPGRYGGGSDDPSLKKSRAGTTKKGLKKKKSSKVKGKGNTNTSPIPPSTAANSSAADRYAHAPNPHAVTAPPPVGRAVPLSPFSMMPHGTGANLITNTTTAATTQQQQPQAKGFRARPLTAPRQRAAPSFGSTAASASMISSSPSPAKSRARPRSAGHANTRTHTGAAAGFVASGAAEVTVVAPRHPVGASPEPYSVIISDDDDTLGSHGKSGAQRRRPASASAAVHKRDGNHGGATKKVPGAVAGRGAHASPLSTMATRTREVEGALVLRTSVFEWDLGRSSSPATAGNSATPNANATGKKANAAGGGVAERKLFSPPKAGHGSPDRPVWRPSSAGGALGHRSPMRATGQADGDAADDSKKGKGKKKPKKKKGTATGTANDDHDGLASGYGGGGGGGGGGAYYVTTTNPPPPAAARPSSAPAARALGIVIRAKDDSGDRSLLNKRRPATAAVGKRESKWGISTSAGVHRKVNPAARAGGFQSAFVPGSTVPSVPLYLGGPDDDDDDDDNDDNNDEYRNAGVGAAPSKRAGSHSAGAMSPHVTRPSHRTPRSSALEVTRPPLSSTSPAAVPRGANHAPSRGMVHDDGVAGPWAADDTDDEDALDDHVLGAAVSRGIPGGINTAFAAGAGGTAVSKRGAAKKKRPTKSSSASASSSKGRGGGTGTGVSVGDSGFGVTGVSHPGDHRGRDNHHGPGALDALLDVPEDDDDHALDEQWETAIAGFRALTAAREAEREREIGKARARAAPSGAGVNPNRGGAAAVKRAAAMRKSKAGTMPGNRDGDRGNVDNDNNNNNNSNNNDHSKQRQDYQHRDVATTRAVPSSRRPVSAPPVSSAKNAGRKSGHALADGAKAVESQQPFSSRDSSAPSEASDIGWFGEGDRNDASRETYNPQTSGSSKSRPTNVSTNDRERERNLSYREEDSESFGSGPGESAHEDEILQERIPSTDDAVGWIPPRRQQRPASASAATNRSRGVVQFDIESPRPQDISWGEAHELSRQWIARPSYSPRQSDHLKQANILGNSDQGADDDRDEAWLEAEAMGQELLTSMWHGRGGTEL